MRFLMFFLGMVISILSVGQSPRLELINSGDTVSHQYNSKFFFAVKNNISGQAQYRFTPDGTTGWIFLENGVDVTPDANSDSTFITRSFLQGDYSLSATKGGNTISLDFIVFVAILDFDIELQDQQNCEEVEIKIDMNDVPEYNNYFGPEQVRYRLFWGDQVVKDFYEPDYITSIAQWIAGESQDKKVKLEITDKFGFIWESNEETYRSVIPDAKDALGINVLDSKEKDAGEAPLEVEFEDRSKNADLREWFLYKDTLDLIPPLVDSLLDGYPASAKKFNYSYQNPGYYGVKLIVTNSTLFCSDTTEVKYVTVHPSLVEVPNVFTPNGDGINDEFRVKTQSLESFHGIILNRWEKKVFEWRDPSQGWNGKINGNDASPGTYYYIIRAKGLEKNSPPNYTKKGSFLLIR